MPGVEFVIYAFLNAPLYVLPVPCALWHFDALPRIPRLALCSCKTSVINKPVRYIEDQPYPDKCKGMAFMNIIGLVFEYFAHVRCGCLCTGTSRLEMHTYVLMPYNVFD
jgi:hypothetical protein